MSFDDVLVVSVSGFVAAFIGLVVFQTLGSALLIALVVTCVLSVILRSGRLVKDNQGSDVPPKP